MLEPQAQSTPEGTIEQATPDPTGNALIRGIVITIVGGALWGLNGTVAKYLMDVYRVEPLWLACARELVACWLFLGAAWVRNRSRLTGVFHDRRSLASIVVIAIGAILFSQVAYLLAIDWTNSGTATVLQALSMPIVLILVCIRTPRRPRRREVAGLILAFTGTYLMATGGNPSQLALPPQGLFWGLMCAAAATILSILPAQMMRKWGNFVVNGLAFLMSGLILACVYHPWNHMPTLDAFGWALVAFSIVFGTFGAYGLYLQGVKEIGSVRGSILSTSEPLVATITSVLLMGVSFSLPELLGMGCILVTVVLTA
ncbi:MAG: DMT family transporter [Olegusella sp.]|nr:DMT family transporter [Olegusella sp.]